MAPPIRTARLSMEAFPECPSEFKPTLEKLLVLLNEQGNALAQALNGNLTRAENMQSKEVRFTVTTVREGFQYFIRGRIRNPLPKTPTSVWVTRVQADDGGAIPLAQMLSWSVAGEMLSVSLLAGGNLAAAGKRVTVTLIVE